MALIATVGAADANSYPTLAEAVAYFATRPVVTAWAAATDPNREAYLIMSTMLTDIMPQAWTGAPASDTQALGWPRTGMLNRNGVAISSAVVPNELKRAICEFAGKVAAADRTGDNALVQKGIKSLTAGPVTLAFSGEISEIQAARFIVPDIVRMMLVPSWLKKAEDAWRTEQPRLLFENL